MTYVSSIEGGIRVPIQATDAGTVVDSGDISITYTFADGYDDFLGGIQYTTVTLETTYKIVSNGTGYVYIDITLTDDMEGYGSICNIRAAFTGDNGSSDVSNFIVYEA